MKNHQGRGLAIESVNKGLEKLKFELSRSRVDVFYLEAVIDITNEHSIKVGEKIFSSPAEKINERDTGTTALYFKKLVHIR